MKSITPQSAFKGTALLILGRIPSRLLGLVREVLAASLFGATRAMDCFNLSYTLVIGLRQLFTEQFFTPIVPTYFKAKEQRGEKAALQSLRAVTTRLCVFSLLISITVFIWAEEIIDILAPGFDPYHQDLSAGMLSWFAIAGIAIILHRYFIGIYTCFFQYTTIAFAPLLFNAGAIGGMVFFAVKFGVVSLAAGISFGFWAYFIILIIFLPNRDIILKPQWGKGDPGVAAYGLMILPLFIAVSVEQIQLFVDRALASSLPEGALSAQGYALRLGRMFPDFLLGTFGVVLFPVFSSMAYSEKRKEFAHNFSVALQGIILILSLFGAIIIPLSLPIVRILLERGSFTYENSVITANLVVIYTFAYAAQVLLVIIIRGFHAHGNTRIPMITTVISVIVMIFLDFILVGPMGINGLALALAVGFILNMTLVYILFSRYLTGKQALLNVKIAFLGIAIASALGWTIAQIWDVLTKYHLVDTFVLKLMSLIIIAVIASIAYLFLLRVLKISALEYIIKKFKSKNETNVLRNSQNLTE